MRKILTTTLITTLLGAQLFAQEAAPAAETTPVAPAAEAEAAAPTAAADATAPVAAQQRAQTPQEIVKAVHGDWQIKCVVAEKEQCLMSQLIVGANNSPLMEISLIPAKIEGEPDAVMGATVVTPHGVMLQKGILLQVDENLPDKKEYTWCNQTGCYSRFPVKAADINGYKSAGKMTAVLFSMQNPRQGLEIVISLTGFTAAFDELMALEGK